MRRIPRAWAVVLLIVLAAPAAAAQAGSNHLVTVFCAPETNLERLDLGLLGGAQTSVDLAGYNLSNHAVIQALCRLAQSGVRVRLYLDSEQLAAALRQALPSHPLHRPSRAANVEIRVHGTQVAMHLKSYLVDGRLLRTGSANFSASGLKRQDNDLVVNRDAAAIARFGETFGRLWARPDNRVWRADR